MAYSGVTRGSAWWLLPGFAFAVGCGGKAENGGGDVSATTGGDRALATGGQSATSSMPAAGAPVTGGAAALGGARPFTGGSPPVSTAFGGAAPTGGKSATGGSVSTGGKSGVGGTVATGGSWAAGGKVGTGGASALGGNSSMGGTTSNDPLSAFCQGDKSKILYQGKQEVLAPATDYVSGLVMDCCMAYGVNLHSRAALGFDLDVETIWSGGATLAPGVITLGSSTARVRTAVRRSTDTASAYGVPAEGTVEVFKSNPLDVGLCLSLYNTETLLYNTFIYVPEVSLASYANQKRFQIFLLSDSTISQSQAVAQGLSAVSLATNPILDISRIAYVSSSANEIGFNPGQKIGDTLQPMLKGSLVLGVPFVIVADGERIALGAFMSGVSSISYGLPSILVENINSDWLVIDDGTGVTNPLKDSRIVTTLTATGKLIP